MITPEIILIVALNSMLSLGYFIYLFFFKKKKQKSFIIFLIIFFCPVIGICFLGSSWLIGGFLTKIRKLEIHIEEISFRKNKIKVISAADIEKESNRVSIEEALLVADKNNKRTVFLDMLKEGNENSIITIKKAVDDEDSEISHYAAAALTDSIARFKEAEKEKRELLESDKNQENLCEYISFVMQFLKYDILAAPEQSGYMERLEEKTRDLNDNYKEYMDGRTIGGMVELWERLGEKDKAEYWVQKAIDICSNDLEAYKVALKFYYKNQQENLFFQLLEQLKKSTLVLDGDSVDWIRFFA